MPLSFWIKRLLIVFTGAAIVLFAVGIAKGRSVQQSAMESAIWSVISTSLFFAARLYHLRKGRRCELCGDAPAEADESAKIPRR